MTITLFHYLYRDAGNFKAFGAVSLAGALSESELNAVRARFPGDGFFIAEQVGVPPLYERLYEWSGGRTEEDHCWHTFISVETATEAKAPAGTVRWGTAPAFLEVVLSVGEWQEELSPHFYPAHGDLVFRRGNTSK